MKLVLPLAVLAVCGHAQWLSYVPPGTPLTREGKPNLAAKAPRAANGKPDLSGAWHTQPTSLDEMKRIYGPGVGDLNVPGMEADTISKYALNILTDFPQDQSPMRPEAAALMRQHAPGANPADHCLPLGIPFAVLVSEPIRIVQSPGVIAVLYESADSHRRIYTDGRPLPKDPDPAWLGYSVGHWEGDTLVVQTAGFNDKTWLDAFGHPHSGDLRVTERFHRRDFGHLDVEMTFDDPKMYTKPFSIKFTQGLLADSDILEFFCAENERDLVHGARK